MMAPSRLTLRAIDNIVACQPDKKKTKASGLLRPNAYNPQKSEYRNKIPILRPSSRRSENDPFSKSHALFDNGNGSLQTKRRSISRKLNFSECGTVSSLEPSCPSEAKTSLRFVSVTSSTNVDEESSCYLGVLQSTSLSDDTSRDTTYEASTALQYPSSSSSNEELSTFYESSRLDLDIARLLKPKWKEPAFFFPGDDIDKDVPWVGKDMRNYTRIPRRNSLRSCMPVGGSDVDPLIKEDMFSKPGSLFKVAKHSKRVKKLKRERLPIGFEAWASKINEEFAEIDQHLLTFESESAHGYGS